VMGGSEALVAYMQRVIGFCLTGVMPDRMFWFLYGRGRNGKSTTVDMLLEMLGDYAIKTTAETLLLRRDGDGIPNDIARLRGARLVVSAELPEGGRLNEARIKDLTGRGLMTARFMRAEFFEFEPVFKLLLYGNHKPTIRGTDDGIWDRVKLLPFTVRIEDDEVDEGLPQKLAAEWPGILAWAVQGCIEWQRMGLGHPPEVTEATGEYREEMDLMAGFTTERCLTGSGYQVSAKALYGDYVAWATENHETPMSQTAFGRRMAERGFERFRDGGGAKWYRGIGLNGSRPVARMFPEQSERSERSE
jgi:putative DNA primase/helicase